jgi:ATP synthase protein I
MWGKPNWERFCFFLGSNSLQKKSEDDRYEAIRRAGLLTTIPVLLAVAPLIGYFIGRFLDGKLGTEPYLGIVFLILGFISGAMQTARLIRIANREPRKKD